jgi:DNA-binding SARP family transcriptional activator
VNIHLNPPSNSAAVDPLPVLGDAAPASAEPLRLTLYGNMQVRDANGNDATPRIRKSRAVLAVLALAAPKPILRDHFAALLWSQRDRDQGRASLRQCVHELQSALSADPLVLLAERNHLLLDNRRIAIDARPGSLSPLQLLSDLDGLDPAFDRWLLVERQRAGRAAMSVAEAALVDGTHAPIDPATAVAAAEQLLSVDPVNESAWRVAIAGHLALGSRSTAMEMYQRCVAVLADRAKVEPSAATRALVAASSATPPAPQRVAHPPRRTRGARLGVRPFRRIDGTANDPLSLGLAEEITTALARFRWFFLVASPSLARLEGEPDDDNPGWRDLALDFLLDGTIQRSGDTIRVSVRLLDLHAGPEVLWAARFDRPASDLLRLQDQIASETVAQIDPAVLLREGERAASLPGDATDAYRLTMGTIPAIYRLEEAAFRAAGPVLAEAIRIDPDYAAAHTWYACWHIFLVGQNWAESPALAMAAAARLAERAVALDPSDARALTVAGHVRAFLHGRIDEAMQLHERALTLNPCLPLAWALSSLADCYAGRHDEAIRRVKQGRSLSPFDPHGFFFDMAQMLAHLMRGEDETVVLLGRQALTLNPQFTSAYKIMLSALGHLGRLDEAAELIPRLLALEPGFRISVSVARTPLQLPQDLARYAKGLVLSGLPQ